MESMGDIVQHAVSLGHSLLSDTPKISTSLALQNSLSLSSTDRECPEHSPADGERRWTHLVPFIDIHSPLQCSHCPWTVTGLTNTLVLHRSTTGFSQLGLIPLGDLILKDRVKYVYEDKVE